MKLRVLVAVTPIALAALAGVALARNPHCAGGIQYVVQGLRDKDKGNAEDYSREMNKAVDQLSQCATEDPADFEAVGYLGWAFAELDSAGPAGQAFQKAATQAVAKGDKKKLEAIEANRDHYWSLQYNEGIARIKEGQDFTDAGEKAEGHKKLVEAVERLTRAKLLKPGDAKTLRNLATAYALDNQFDPAEAVLKNGLTEAAKDTSVGGLNDALKAVRANKASALLNAGKIDEAIGYYSDLVKTESSNGDLYTGLGDALFKRAGSKPDAEKKADFKAAGDAYAKAYSLKTDDSNVAFNAALSYQNAGEMASAEAMWRSVLKKTPDDADALSSLGSVLADEKKFDEARDVLQHAIQIKPDEKVYFRQLAAVYSKQGNNAKTTEMMFVFLPMANGTPAADPGATVKAAKAGSAAANTLASMGVPDKLLQWTDNTAGALQTWVYAKKRLAFTFNAAGLLVQKSDWSVPAK